MNEKEKILIVEDEKNTRFIFERLLSKNNFDVHAVTNGEEALNELKNFFPKIILADWTMPIMDGLTLCNIVKNDEKLRSIYFIILTAKTSLRDRITGLDVGADDFLLKPIENQELLARIKSGVRIYNLQTELMRIERSKAIIELACTIGHKINNPLASLSLALSNLEEEVRSQKTKNINADFDAIKQSIDRIKTLVTQLTRLENPEVIPYTDDIKMLKLD